MKVQSQSLFTRYQLPLFFLLSYLLSWWAMLLGRGLLPHGVAISAVIIIALTTGKTGLREFWGRLINFRAGWLFLIGPAIIIGYNLVDVVINLLVGETVIGPPHLPSAAVAVELLLLGGLWEEPGWSGYALPTLQKRFAKSPYSALIATLVVGIFRGIWHLPLVIVGAIPWYDAAFFSPFVFQTFISWLYNKSGGSVPVVMLFHYMSNVLFIFMKPVFAGTDTPMYTILYMTCGGLAALALAWKTRFKLGWGSTGN